MALLACFTFGFFPGEYLSIFNPGRREADQFAVRQHWVTSRCYWTSYKMSAIILQRSVSVEVTGARRDRRRSAAPRPSAGQN